MAKLIVVDEIDGNRSPFLRGIMVQSLVNAGITFDRAYDLAQAVRNDLQEAREITSRELRERVARLLEERYGSDIRVHYEASPGSESEIVVHTSTRSAPFSVGILAHSLETCAIEPEMAIQGAHKVLGSLRKTGHRDIDHKALRRIIYRCLHEHCSKAAAERYLSWRRFENSGIPLIILVGGATGSGKSTLSSELAYRLGISHLQSTDMMREIIRAYLSPQMVPTLMYSSFDAWRGLPGSTDSSGPAIDNSVITGFMSQFSTMKLALDSTISRAIEERHHLVLEGVHVVPTELDLQQDPRKAVVIPIMLASMKKEMLGRQLTRRGSENARRSTTNHVDNLDDIWELQSWLLDEADRAGIYTIENWCIEEAAGMALKYIIGELQKHFPPSPDDDI